jgi:hypothetical protein
LIAAHLNDSGLVRDRELALEILDMFGISEKSFDGDNSNFLINRKVHDPNTLRKIVKDKTNLMSSNEVQNQDQIDAQIYEKHIVQAKHGRNVSNNKIINQTQSSSGIGRIESSLVDNFILSRNLNESELIFN